MTLGRASKHRPVEIHAGSMIMHRSMRKDYKSDNIPSRRLHVALNARSRKDLFLHSSVAQCGVYITTLQAHMLNCLKAAL